MALFINKSNNFEKKEVRDERTDKIREALRTYVRKNNMENAIAKEKNSNILNSLIED